MYYQSTTNKMRLFFYLFIYFCKTLYMFQTVFPSIIRSSKLHIQRHVFVRPLLLPAAPLKSALKGRRIHDATDIRKNATKELKRLSQNGFQECFQYIYSRWQNLHRVTILREICLKVLYNFAFLRNKVIPGIFLSYKILINKANPLI